MNTIRKPLPKPRGKMPDLRGKPWPKYAPILEACHILKDGGPIGAPQCLRPKHVGSLYDHARDFAAVKTKHVPLRRSRYEGTMYRIVFMPSVRETVFVALVRRLSAARAMMGPPDSFWLSRNWLREPVAVVMDVCNNHPGASEAFLARIWNATMADLGYVVGNPEALKKGRSA